MDYYDHLLVVARRRRHKIKPQVSAWMAEALKNIQAARSLLDKGSTSNPKWFQMKMRYTMGKKARDHLELVKGILERATFEIVSHPAPHPLWLKVCSKMHAMCP